MLARFDLISPAGVAIGWICNFSRHLLRAVLELFGKVVWPFANDSNLGFRRCCVDKRQPFVSHESRSHKGEVQGY
jgi:hypothetical protein